MNERNIYFELRDLEIKMQIETMDKKLPKHKNMELDFYYLVAYTNERMNQLHKEKITLGKRNDARDKKEVLRSWNNFRWS